MTSRFHHPPNTRPADALLDYRELMILAMMRTCGSAYAA